MATRGAFGRAIAERNPLRIGIVPSYRSGVVDESDDGGDEAGDRRQPGQLGVRECLRRQDDGKQGADDAVAAQPARPVGAQHTAARGRLGRAVSLGRVTVVVLGQRRGAPKLSRFCRKGPHVFAPGGS